MPVTTKKTATKAKATTAKDVVLDTTTQIEKLTQKTAIKFVDKLLDDGDFNFFKTGGALLVIKDNGWYSAEGYDSMVSFVEDRYGMKSRKADYLMGIYAKLVELEIDWTDVKNIGWTKLRLIISAMTEENKDDLLKKAGAMTYKELHAAVKGATPTKEPGKEDEKDTGTTSKSFKLHEDQLETVNHALEKAKDEGQTDVDSVALEYICLQYLESKLGKPAKGKTITKEVKVPMTLEESMTGKELDEVLNVVDKLFPDAEITVTV